MIIHTEPLALSIAPIQLLTHLRTITTQPYQPISCGYTHSYELKELPDFRLMEGVIVPPHSDGIAGYRPILMLHNPSNSYVIRGVGQDLKPQPRGTLVVLDIDAEHEVRSKDPNGRLGPWSGLVWGPEGRPCMKAEWDLEELVERAKEKIEELCTEIGKLT